MKYWVNQIISPKELIPHVKQYHPGYRIFVPVVNLMMESTGTLWKSVQLKTGDEIIDISKAESLKI